MKYVKYVGAGLLLLLAAVFLLGTITDEKHLLYAVLMLACAAGAWALTRPPKKKKRRRPTGKKPGRKPAERREQLTPEELQEQVWARAAAMVPKTDEEKTGDHDFEYTRVGLYRPDSFTGELPRVGEDVYFEEEPTNPYDAEAILARTSGGEPVGYLNKGKLRNVVRRALENMDDIDAQISRIDGRLECYIAIDRAE